MSHYFWLWSSLKNILQNIYNKKFLEIWKQGYLYLMNMYYLHAT